MRIHNPESYELVGFEVNKGKRAKYIAIIQNKKTKEKKRIPFGMKGFQQYEDKIGYYREFDHNDEKRRENWIKRHKRNIDYKFSSAWFSNTFLWS